MPRSARRYQTERALIFHVLNRGILRQPIFHDDNDAKMLMDTIKRYKMKYAFDLYHWCIMPNHYHLVIKLEHSANLTKLIGACQQIYSANYHKKYKTAGRLFQNRFKSQAIENDAYLLACGRYVELNPVRAGLIEQSWEWRNSSAAYYVNNANDGYTTCDPEWISDGRELKYREWLLDAIAANRDREIFSSSKHIIGSESFKRRLILEKGRVVLRGRGRPRKALNI